MNRLRNISEKTKNKINYLKNVKYTSIPLDISDIYIISKDGDRLDNLSDQFYKDPDLWWIISKANPNKIKRDSFFITPGLQIRIPMEIDFILEDFEKINE